jgi:hypothetical protein
MDEQEREARIAALFRDATAEAPPPGFDAGDVVAASRRITRRRRSALAGAALAVLAVAGVGVTAGFGGSSGSELTSAAGSARGAPDRNGSAQDAAAPEAARAAAPEAPAPDAAGAAGGSAPGAGADAAAPVPGSAGSVPGGGPTTGLSAGAVPPAGAPLGPGNRECADRQDPALRALVEQVLPEVAGASEAVTTMECRPGGERGVALEVSDGASSGLLSVTYLPPGSAAAVPAGARSAPTASGGTVLVSSRPERQGQPAPLADRLDAAVAYLAPRL